MATGETRTHLENPRVRDAVEPPRPADAHDRVQQPADLDALPAPCPVLQALVRVLDPLLDRLAPGHEGAGFVREGMDYRQIRARVARGAGGRRTRWTGARGAQSRQTRGAARRSAVARRDRSLVSPGPGATTSGLRGEALTLRASVASLRALTRAKTALFCHRTRRLPRCASSLGDPSSESKTVDGRMPAAAACAFSKRSCKICSVEGLVNQRADERRRRRGSKRTCWTNTAACEGQSTSRGKRGSRSFGTAQCRT